MRALAGAEASGAVSGQRVEQPVQHAVQEAVEEAAEEVSSDDVASEIEKHGGCPFQLQLSRRFVRPNVIGTATWQSTIQPKKSIRLLPPDLPASRDFSYQGRNQGLSRCADPCRTSTLSSMTFTDSPKEFVRSDTEKIVAGVCGGVADYFDIDVNLVRVLTVIGAVISFGTVALVYLAAWMLMPLRG